MQSLYFNQGANHAIAMIKIIPRYIVKEHIGPFFFALLVMNSIFILNLLFREMGKFLSKGLPLSVILEFLFLNLAWMIALSVPMAVLTATIMAFGRLSAENEITAIKAGGISLYQMLPSLLLLSMVVAGLLIWFNNAVLPDFNHRARLLMVDIARKKPMISLEAGVVYRDIPNYSILVESVEEKDSVSYVERITIDDQNVTNIIKTIRANSGEISFNKETGLLEIVLFEGQVQKIDIRNPEELEKVDFKKHILKIPMSEMLLVRSQSEYRGDREKSASALMEDVHKNYKKILLRRQKLNNRIAQHLSDYIYSTRGVVHKSLPMVVREHARLNRKIDTDINLINSYKRSSNVFLVEVHKKYSIPAICIVFVLIGAPLGILTRQRGWAAAAGLSIGFFLLYWAFLIGGETLADRQKISAFWGMWSPNLLVGIMGLYLVWRTIRESSSVRLPQFLDVRLFGKTRRTAFSNPDPKAVYVKGLSPEVPRSQQFTRGQA
ncbi:MAG: LptF/LptG family permease [bacterium]